MVVLSDLRAGVLHLPRVVDQCRTHTFEHFEAFLQVFECFGMGFSDDIDHRKYKIREKESHRETAINQLRRIIRLYQIAIDQITQEDFLMFSRYSEMNSNVLRDQLVALFEF